MKAILITYNQAYYDDIAKLLNDNGMKGYTEWDEIKGHGSNTGEPHLGSHAWPTLNNAIVSIVEDDRVDAILNDLHEHDLKAPELGLRAFVWNIEKMI
jgi:nitrogen regulatory protein PII